MSSTKRKASNDSDTLPNKQPRLTSESSNYIHTAPNTIPSGIIPLGGVAHPITQLTSTSLSSVPIIGLPPPPPYPSSSTDPVPIAATTSNEEFTCSSPSQFLHSPTTVHTTSPSTRKITSPSLTSPKINDTTRKLRSKVLSLKKAKAIEMKLNYEKMLQEKFFLEGGGLMIDYQLWRKKPNILKEQYLKQHDLDTEGVTSYDELLSPRDVISEVSLLGTGGATPLDIESFTTNTSQQHKTTVPSIILTHVSTTTVSLTSTPTANTNTTVLSSPNPTTTTATCTSAGNVSNTASASVRVSLSSDVSHEDIVMRARHEAEVMKAISELRKEGLWSSTRLPKVQEPSRPKTHWDYVLEEMRWLATDFCNERRWKINACKKVNTH